MTTVTKPPLRLDLVPGSKVSHMNTHCVTRRRLARSLLAAAADSSVLMFASMAAVYFLFPLRHSSPNAIVWCAC
jgi:hypothetical protein